MFENLNTIISLVSAGSLGLGGLLTWFYTKNQSKKKATSELSRDAYVALEEVIDKLMIKTADLITKISEKELSESLKGTELTAYKSLIRELKIQCDELCKNGAMCKAKIIEGLSKYGLKDE
tara:strand:+ start:853 stop:1215 length:363 start_codon:yes stop_codon:yes gene_type:complete